MVYNHKSAKAIEYMIVDGLLAAEKHLHIADKVFEPEEYVYLTDNVMPFIQASRDPVSFSFILFRSRLSKNNEAYNIS